MATKQKMTDKELEELAIEMQNNFKSGEEEQRMLLKDFYDESLSFEERIFALKNYLKASKFYYEHEKTYYPEDAARKYARIDDFDLFIRILDKKGHSIFGRYE